MAFYDADRAVLYTRSKDVLRAAVFAYVGGVIEDLAGSGTPPALDDRSVDALLEPVPQGCWREVHLQQSTHSWTCEFRGYGTPTQRWIGNTESGWRTGWLW